eukprot:1147236-Pelagomonas_calceolata.AAC.2
MPPHALTQVLCELISSTPPLISTLEGITQGLAHDLDRLRTREAHINNEPHVASELNRLAQLRSVLAGLQQQVAERELRLQVRAHGSGREACAFEQLSGEDSLPASPMLLGCICGERVTRSTSCCLGSHPALRRLRRAQRSANAELARLHGRLASIQEEMSQHTENLDGSRQLGQAWMCAMPDTNRAATFLIKANCSGISPREPVVVSVMLLVAWSGGPRLGKGKAYSLISSLVDSCAVPGLLLEVDLGLNWDWRFRLSYHHAAIETSIICSTHVAFN